MPHEPQKSMERFIIHTLRLLGDQGSPPRWSGNGLREGRGEWLSCVRLGGGLGCGELPCGHQERKDAGFHIGLPGRVAKRSRRGGNLKAVRCPVLEMRSKSLLQVCATNLWATSLACA